MKYYVVDAFTTEQFKGNPAGVCVLEGEWPSAETMQKIAAENRLSETAFVNCQEDGSYVLRYFSPGSEVGLCGHATLGTSYVLAHFVDPEASVFHYHTRDEDVAAYKLPGDRYELDFPAWEEKAVEVDERILAALNGIRPLEVLETRDLTCILESEEAVRNFVPDQEAIDALPDKYLGLLITARGENSDFVDRSVFPKHAIPEDPVCGSAKCTLIPLWSKRLGKNELVGHQLSPRTGVVYCRHEGDRVKISGNVALYMAGEINIQEGQ